MMPFSYLATEKPLKLSKILDPSRCIIAERENMPADLSEEDFYTEMKKSNPVLKREEVRIIEKGDSRPLFNVFSILQQVTDPLILSMFTLPYVYEVTDFPFAETEIYHLTLTESQLNDNVLLSKMEKIYFAQLTSCEEYFQTLFIRNKKVECLLYWDPIRDHLDNGKSRPYSFLQFGIGLIGLNATTAYQDAENYLTTKAFFNQFKELKLKINQKLIISKKDNAR
ncbi:hypothetical protein [Carnobacterium maltaromaticum]|uniref:hypothetical protein n=1 Tax=Carnobacterium maltaromaticum TaxID=2751 RepID=UPI00107283BA|nr:hypothetical protein [Carnobacterium maltaromaticum]TFJ75033.1 hypothetical protein CKN94_08410 [Carnobacterium maltaromaticum]TFJ78293.1 hypothetical protein CKN97_08405 [Carnobacterium maltaromaticum]